MPGPRHRRVRTLLQILTIGAGCLACMAIAGVLAVLALYLLATL